MSNDSTVDCRIILGPPKHVLHLVPSPDKIAKAFRDVCKKTGKMWEFFQSQGPPTPSPQFGNAMFVRRKKSWFILHFRTLGTFLVFTKMFTF